MATVHRFASETPRNSERSKESRTPVERSKSSYATELILEEQGRETHGPQRLYLIQRS